MSTTAITQKSVATFWEKSGTLLRANARHAWVPLCLAAGLISLARGQDACWDLQNYHLYNAFAVLHPHRHDVDIAQSQSFLNPLLDIPLYLLTITFTHTPEIIAFCMGLPFGILAFFTFRIASRLFGWRDQTIVIAVIAVIAALFGLTGTATASQIGLSTNEIPIAALVIAGFDALLIAVNNKAATALPLLLAGLLTGLAVGAKLTAAPYAAGLAAAALFAFPPRRLGFALCIIGAAGAVGVGATGGFWMAHLYATYDNPIFPFDNQIFRSAWAGPWAYNDVRFFPHTPIEWALFPFWWVRLNRMVVTEIPFADPRFAAVFILCALALLDALRRRCIGALLPPPEWRAVIIFWLVGYILWEKLFSIYRYAVPLELLGGMLAVGAIRGVLPAKPRRAATAALLLTTAICAATTYPNWGHRPFHGASIPVHLPALPARSLIVSTGPQAVSFLALRAPAATVFVGAATNFEVPDTTLTWRAITNTIESWHGPIEIIEPVQGDQVARNVLSAEFNLAATDQCQPIKSVWNYDSLRLCTAHLLGASPGYQPAISFGFASGDVSGAAYIRDGWAPTESFGRWSMAPDATVVLPVNPANTRPLLLTVLAFSIPSATAPGRHADVYANGQLVAHWALNTPPMNYQATIPNPHGATQLTLRFHILDPATEAEQAALGNDRALGIAMMRLSLQEILTGQ